MTEIVTRTAQPLVLFVLARLLVPEDFGIVGAAMIVISFLTMFLDAGLGKALIQTNAPLKEAANVVFWINITLGAMLYIAIFLAAPLMANFFNSPASAPVLRILGIQVMILSLTTVQQFLFMRTLNFRQLFWAKLAVALTPAFFSIPLAFFGHGVWALVTGTLVGSFLKMIILWIRSPWRPSFSFDSAIARRLLYFGFWIVLEGFGIWLITWGDQLLVGKFLTIKELGIYRTGWSISALLFGLLLNPIIPVLYPTFSRFQDDREHLIVMFHKANRMIISFAFPMGLGLLLIAPEIANVLFGDIWKDLGFVLALMGFLNGASWLVGANVELYRSIGRPDVNTKLMWAQLLYFLPVYLVTIQYGMKAFIIGRVIVGMLAIPIHILLAVRILGVSPLYLWHQGKNIFYAGMVMIATISTYKVILKPAMKVMTNSIVMISLILTGIFMYTGVLWVLDRNFVINTKRTLVNVLKSR